MGYRLFALLEYGHFRMAIKKEWQKRGELFK